MKKISIGLVILTILFSNCFIGYVNGVSNISFRAGTYRLDRTGRYILDIVSYTTVEDFKRNIITSQTITISSGGHEVKEENETRAYIKTGDLVTIGSKIYIAVVLGDINQDGKCNYKDILLEQWAYDHPDLDFSRYVTSTEAEDEVFARRGNMHRVSQSLLGRNSSDILSTCVEVLQYMIDKNITYNAQTYGDIEKTATTDTAFVCATYVAVVLYESGALTADQINPYNYHYTHDFGNMLENAGWYKVQHSEIQPGDIINCFGGQISANNEHVMIYAGNDACYDEQCAQGLHSTEPRADEWNWYKNLEGTTVWRAPYTSVTNNDAELQQVVDNATNTASSTAGGKWAVYASAVNSNDQATKNDSRMQAASLIKLFIMGAVYENYSNLQSSSSEINSKLYSMITVSDNDSANWLVTLLGNGDSSVGRNKVSQFCSTHGYSQTTMGRMLLASNAYADNYTSVSDCGKFLKSVYKGELSHSNEMLNLLKQQQRTSKIPAGVPSGVQVANKTGELSDVENDAAIVLTDNPYVLVVMTENQSNTSLAVSQIKNISTKVYNYFTNNERNSNSRHV